MLDAREQPHQQAGSGPVVDVAVVPAFLASPTRSSADSQLACSAIDGRTLKRVHVCVVLGSQQFNAQNSLETCRQAELVHGRTTGLRCRPSLLMIDVKR